ncbi:MAG: sodium-dependent transporter [Victivallales bacterium]|nr:sodium-dependent transporter [Victivallales bacterium]
MSENTEPKRETLATRLGFLMLAAGCAVGLGNVWRFPYIVGKYGGGMFVLLYLAFLALLGFPVLLMELSLGKASRQGYIGAFRTLANGHRPLWTGLARLFFLGNLLLMMYYTTVTGWLFSYTRLYAGGEMSRCTTPEEIAGQFSGLLASPGRSAFYMLLACILGTALCYSGLQKGVENSVKYMMGLLFALMLLLGVNSLMMPEAAEGLRFYLLPNWSRFSEHPLDTVFAAMGQAFFTLSLGIGSIEIFGSYISWKKSLVKESITIIALDTLVALAAGFIIFPVCTSQHLDVSSGPGLIFISLPHVFHILPGGRFWGALFFLFLSMAALTTVIAVFENIIACLMDEFKLTRQKATLLTGFTVAILSMPCVFGFNLWKSIQPMGQGTGILDLEDFIVSQNMLPLGSLLIVLFCTMASGWGCQGLNATVTESRDKPLGRLILFYCRWLLPLLMSLIFVLGYLDYFHLL